MNKPTLELKKVKTFRGMEGFGFNAELWINGIFCIFVIDEANGGCFNYEEQGYKNPKADKIKANIKEFDAWIASLPPREIKGYGGKPFSIKVNRDSILDDLMNELEAEKFKKKMSRNFEKGICYGTSKRYVTCSWTGRTLAQIDKITLQREYDKIKSELKAGETILNTNLEALGVRL